MRVNPKELASGGIFVVAGLFFAITALRTLDIGTANQMGPAYFPLLLSSLLILMGIGVALRGMTIRDNPFGAIPWRALAMISLAPIVFALTVRGLGLFLAVTMSAFLAAMGSRVMPAGKAAWISLALAAFCVALFTYGLRLPLPVFGLWLSL